MLRIEFSTDRYIVYVKGKDIAFMFLERINSLFKMPKIINISTVFFPILQFISYMKTV